MTASARLDLDGRIVVVAGAGGGGIGTTVCRVVAEAGGTVVALDLLPGALDAVEEAVARTPGAHRCLVTDVRDPAQLEAALDATSALGPLHGLVHVAGAPGLNNGHRCSTCRSNPSTRCSSSICVPPW